MCKTPERTMVSMKVRNDLLEVLDTHLAEPKKSRTSWFEDKILEEFGKKPLSETPTKHHWTRSDAWKERFMAAVQPGVNMLYEVLERMGDGWQPKATCRKALLGDLILEGRLMPFSFNGRYTSIEKARGKS